VVSIDGRQPSLAACRCTYMNIFILCYFYLENKVTSFFLPALRKRGNSYTATWRGWLGGWLSVTAGIVSKRLNLSENFFDHLVAPSFRHLRPLTPIPNSKGNLFSGGAKYTGVGKLAIFVRFSTDIAVYLGNGAR